MSIMYKKSLALILCICLIVAYVASPVNAKTGTIEFNGQEYEIVVNNQDIITMKQDYEGHEITASLDKITNEITAEVVEPPNNLMRIGNSNKHKYIIEVQNMDENGITAMAKDVDTYQVIDIDKNSTKSDEHNNKLVAQAPLVLIPLAEVLGGLLAALLAAAATVVILGETYTLVSDIASAIKNNKSHDYFPAKIVNNDVWIGGAFDSRSAALSYLRASGLNNVFTKTNSLASSLASSVAGSSQYCTLPHNTDGFYPHYHPYAGGAKLSNHVWFF